MWWLIKWCSGKQNDAVARRPCVGMPNEEHTSHSDAMYYSCSCVMFIYFFFLFHSKSRAIGDSNIPNKSFFILYLSKQKIRGKRRDFDVFFPVSQSASFFVVVLFIAPTIAAQIYEKKKASCDIWITADNNQPKSNNSPIEFSILLSVIKENLQRQTQQITI